MAKKPELKLVGSRSKEIPPGVSPKTLSAGKLAEARTADILAQKCLENCIQNGIPTAWDRFDLQQPQCLYGQNGICCVRCAMGPCKINPEHDQTRSVCGADADLIVARNLLDMIATGAAAHSDHGREIVETMQKTGKGTTQGYTITDTRKMKAIAQEFGIDPAKKDEKELARDLSDALLEEYGSRKEELQFVRRVPPKTLALWKEAGIIPRGVDREIVESMHRIHMGVGADYTNILLHGLRTSLADGWGGSMIATECSDILFGTPAIVKSQVNLGVVKKDQVNISLHGHNPLLSEAVIRVSREPDLAEAAKKAGANGINLVGLCCTGNEILMRQGVPIAGNFLNQELLIATGVLDAMVVDYQCIYPSIPQTAACYHTVVISTSPKSIIPGSYHINFQPENAEDVARAIIQAAIKNFPNRDPQKIFIPGDPVTLYAGFSVEAILKALGGTLNPLLDAIKKGAIRGVVGIVGCNNPKLRQDFSHVTLAKKLIAKDVLCVETGCAAIASGKAGLLTPEAAEMAGENLKGICKALGMPPVLHVGSCVDNSRILVILAAMANALNVGIHQLPVVGVAPEYYSQKAVAIGSYFAASGVTTVLGPMPNIGGSAGVVNLLTSDLSKVVHASFLVEPDPVKAADRILEIIEEKRTGLGI
jgi:carbon-monoxide dehydrogenase catalytic subunit